MKPAILSSAETDDLVRLDDAHWTTRENLHDEKRLLEALSRLHENAVPLTFEPEFLEKQKRNFIHDKAQKTDMQELNEQARVVFEEMIGAGTPVLLTGPPGAAKSTVAALWTNLAREAVPEIPVMAMTQEKPALQRVKDKLNLKNVAAMVFDEALNVRTAWPEGAILVIDEAGLLGTNKMARLLARAADAKARRVIMIGDDKQLLPADPGQPFRWLRQSGKVPVIALHFPFRQKTPALRRMVDTLYSGDVAAALDEMSLEFVPTDGLTHALKKLLDDKAPDKTLVAVHGDETLLQKLRGAGGGYRFYSLAAAQGLAVDHIVLVIGAKITLPDLLVGVSRQRFALDILVDQTIYADKASLRDSLGDYPTAKMALDIVGEEKLLQIIDEA